MTLCLQFSQIVAIHLLWISVIGLTWSCHESQKYDNTVTRRPRITMEISPGEPSWIPRCKAITANWTFVTYFCIVCKVGRK